MTDIAPPATAVWYDLQATVEQVLAILRLTEQDVDVARIEALVPVQAYRIDVSTDRVEVIEGPPPPAAIEHALVMGVVELYQDKGDTSTFVASTPLRTDVLHAKQRWGVG